MTRKIKSGGAFVTLGGGATNTGDATAADVASGKTFSSTALLNVAGTNTKNATVPSNALILPPQAYVDYGLAVIALFQSLASAGAIVTTAQINTLLVAAATAGVNSIIDLSGPDMGVPTPAQVEIAGYATFDCGNVNGGTVFTIRTANADAAPVHAYFDSGIPFADSTSVNSAFSVTIGLADSPTPQQIVTELLTGTITGNSFINLIYLGAGQDNGDGTFTYYCPPGFRALPLTISDATASDPGSGFVKNASITATNSNGATITVEEWGDRVGPNNGGSSAKESVTYYP